MTRNNLPDTINMFFMALSPDCVMRVSCCQRFMKPVAKLFFFVFSLSSCTDWNCQKEHGRKKVHEMGCCHGGIRPPPCEEINQMTGTPARAPGY